MRARPRPPTPRCVGSLRGAPPPTLKLLQLSIARRLWLGLSLIVALFAIAHLVSLRATRELDRVLSTVVSAGQGRAAAVQAMKVHLDAMDRAIRDFVDGGTPEQRSRLATVEKSFDKALEQYRATAHSADVRELADATARAFEALRGEVDRVANQRTARADTMAARGQLLDALRQLLADMPAADLTARQAPSVLVQAAVDDVRTPLQQWLQAGLPTGREAETGRRALEGALRRYRKIAQTGAQRAWADRASAWLAQERRQASQLRAAVQVTQPGMARVRTKRNELDQLLDRGLQPAAMHELHETVQQASATVHESNLLASRVLALALLFAIIVALGTSRAVRAPLRALVASTRRLAGGDLGHRVPVAGRDELGELTAAFNEMAGKLQASTVSRSYVESIVDSMGEALLVIAPDGRVQTANRAAHRLLGYAEGELAGKPFSALAAIPAQEQPRAWPASVDMSLKTRDGTLVPVALSAVPLRGQESEAQALVCIAQDLRERIAAAHYQRQTAVAFENTREGMVLTDAERNIIAVNPAFVDITGYSRAEVEGRALGLLWSKEHYRRLSSHIWSEVDSTGQWQGEVWLRRKGGELRPVWKNIAVVRDAAGAVVNHVAVFSDITAIKDAEERLAYLAYHDPLTDLPNRLLLHDRLAAALERAARSGASVALLYLDLDHFKHVNDTLGHEEGDRLLQAMAARIGGCVGGTERVARLGGDEFVVVAEGVHDPREAAQLAERILEALSAPVELAGLELRMRASIGISLGPQHGASGDALLKAADAAMYRAKRAGRTGYAFFSEEMTLQALERLTLENGLRHPDLRDQLMLHYQPQVEIETGTLVGVEALVRWMHPVRGLLSPAVFVPVAEDAGLAHVIGEWAMQRACLQARQWSDRGKRPVRMSVNVSAHELRSDRLVDAVAKALRESGLPPAQLELEVTEGALQTGGEAERVLEKLKQLGVQLALDDFGTGYSALSSLKLLPFDRLKIDRAFVRGLEEDPNDRALAKAIIAMGRSLGLHLIAEGVETPGQLAFLRKEGCDEMQGFLVSRPLPADELERALLR